MGIASTRLHGLALTRAQVFLTGGELTDEIFALSFLVDYVYALGSFLKRLTGQPVGVDSIAS